MPSPQEAISNILQRCNLKQLKQIHAFILATSLLQNTQIALKFLRRGTEFGSMDYADLIFSQMGGVFCTEITFWNAMIRGYAFNGPTEEALSMYDEVRQRGLQPNNFTYPYVLNSCSELGSFSIGQKVHSQIVKSGFESGTEVGSSLFKMYVKLAACFEPGVGRSDNLKEVRKVFDDICIKPIELWNQMIFRYGMLGAVECARQVFDVMPGRDVVSWNTMISSYAKAGDTENARDLFDKMPERNVVSWTSMVGAYAESGNLNMARIVFEKMPWRNTVSWNCMISCYAQHEKFKEVLDLFVRMQSEGLTADGFTFVSVLSACSHLHALEFGKWTHYLIQDWSKLGVMVGTSLVEMYANCGDLNRAFTIFIKIEKKDVFCHNVMIKSLAIHGRTDDAIKIFSLLQKTGLKPNDYTLSSALFACSHGGMVKHGKMIFHGMERDFGIRPKLEHYGCFIDLLSRNGFLEEALVVVKEMPFEADTAIWGALLGGCRARGDFKMATKVIEMVDRLKAREPGVYVLMSNIFALLGQWEEAGSAREKMGMKKIWKKVGYSRLVHSGDSELVENPKEPR